MWKVNGRTTWIPPSASEVGLALNVGADECWTTLGLVAFLYPVSSLPAPKFASIKGVLVSFEDPLYCVWQLNPEYEMEQLKL